MNTFIIIVISLILALAVYIYLTAFRTEKFRSHINSYEELKKYVSNEIDKTTSLTGLGIGLSVAEANKQFRQREDIRRYIRKSASGERGIRKSVNQLIKNKILVVVNKNNIESILPFAPDIASPRTKFETLLYTYDTQNRYIDNDEEQGLANALEDDGLSNIIKEHDIKGYFPEELLNTIYEQEVGKMEFVDKIYILTQLIFSDLYALGVIDTLNYQVAGVEEIQLGINGQQKQMYDYKKIFDGTIIEKGAKDSVDIMFQGYRISLPFLGFPTDTEMQRVIRNLIIDCNAGELTEYNPMVKAETIDGRRITAAIPPITDSWFAYIRKTDSIPAIDIEKLYPDPLLNGTIKNLVRTRANICVTGEPESGKTTILRSLLKMTDKNEPIRTIESEHFEINGRKYLPDRNITALLITEDFDEEAILALAKRTSGSVFALGELSNLSLVKLNNKVSKFASQTMSTAHYTSSHKMVADAKYALLNKGGFSNERLAEIEAVQGLCLDIHVVKRGKRYISYINEIILTSKSYQPVTLLEYDTETGTYLAKNKPSESLYKKAKDVMSKEEYQQFIDFFNEYYGKEDDEVVAVPSWVKK